MKDAPPFKPATAVTQLGREPGAHLGAVNTPVYRASTIVFDSVADLDAVRRGEYPGIVYGLHGLPTVTDLQDAFAALEGGHGALAVPSGLAAITLALLAVVGTGDHVLITDAVYGPTRRFCDNQLRRFGVDVSFYDPLIGSGIAEQMRPNTRVIFVESPGSLTFEVQDVPAIAAVAKAHGALVIMDNTWATPLGFPAFARGVDISVHAGTKYLGGHADLLNGVIVANAETFPKLHRLWTDMGVAASPDDCFLALRGLRTLALRLQRHTESTLAITRWLATRPEVAEVVYPALPGARAGTNFGRGTLPAPAACSGCCCILPPRPRWTPCSMACACSKWVSAGAALRASSCPRTSSDRGNGMAGTPPDHTFDCT